MIDSTVPSHSLVAAFIDAAASVIEFADHAPDKVGRLPEPMRIWIAGAEPAIRSVLGVSVQRELWPDAPVIERDNDGHVVRAPRKGGAK